LKINRDAEKLHYDIFRNLTRFCAYDSVMKTRVSSGFIADHYLVESGKKVVG
jgi:hypothetical protein